MLLKKFEEQAARTPRNIAVKTNGTTHTYSELSRYAAGIARLISRIGSGETVGLLFDHGVDMIAAILGTLKAGKIYVPLSVDYPENRLSYMLSDSESSLIVTGSAHVETAARLTATLNIPVLNIDESRVESGAGDEKRRVDAGAGAGDRIAYILYTSGSTGKPKGVYQTHGNADYYVRNWIRLFSITSVDRMTLFSSFCHDGSVQDMFSALYTGATLYPLHLKNRESSVELARFLIEEGITIWHSVPSLYSYFAGTLTGVETFPLLRWILLGGEPVREHEAGMLNRYFPHSVLANVYGQTESSVSSVCVIRRGEAYGLPLIGTPLDETEILLIDKEGDPVGPLQTGEILIGSPYISPGYWKNPEATSAVFAGDEEFGRLYWTGDLGRLLVDGSIEFLGRRDHQVKIRGFRVEPGEIETRLLQHQSVTEAVVTLREDERGDKYLCAYIVAADVDSLREFLSQELPDYMIPSYFVQLEKMPLTPSGKIDRKALPTPGRGELTTVYIAPRDDVEKKLLEIWEEILNTKGFGIDDNFFELGGHSLKAAVTAGRIHKALNVRLLLTEIFRNPTIRSLAASIKGQTRAGFTAVEAVEKREYYAVSSAQKRIYFLQQFAPGTTAYNISTVLVLEGDLRVEMLEESFRELTARHESLRTSFCMIDDEPVQKIQKNVTFQFVGTEHCSVRTKPFDLSEAPLLRVGLVKKGEREHLLMVDMHHIITDGTSQAILAREFIALYRQEELPPLRIQYKDYARWRNRLSESEEMKRQEMFWVEQFSQEPPLLDLPTDYVRPVVQSFAGGSSVFELGAAETAGLKNLAGRADATLYMVLSAVTTIFLSKITGQEDIVTGTAVAGRGHADLETVIGMFVNTLAIRNFPSANKTLLEFLTEVKERTTNGFDNQDFPFEELVEKVVVKRDTGRNPLFDVMFVLQNFDARTAGIPEIEIENLKMKPYGYNDRTAKTDLTFTGVEAGGKLIFNLGYCTALFKAGTVQRFINYFRKTVSNVLDNPDALIGEMGIITRLEKQQILYEFNNTAADYSKDKTIHQLFGEQAQRTPDHIAVTAHLTGYRSYRTHMTYSRLNLASNHLAGSLQKKGVEPGAIVAIKMENSIEMIIGILGILKAGGAYMPIDPDYPEERIDFMLKDSGAEIIITACDGAPDLTAHPAPRNSQPATSLSYVIYTSGTTGRPKGCAISHQNVLRLLTGDCQPVVFDENDVWVMAHSYCFDFSVWEMYGALLWGGELIIPSRQEVRDISVFLELIKRYGVTVLNQTPAAFYSLAGEAVRTEEKHLDRHLRVVIFGGDKLEPAYLKSWVETYPLDRVRLVNMYGITETAIHVTHYTLREEDIFSPPVLSPIGVPLPGTTVYVLSPRHQLQPVSIAGELYVGGSGVSRGYLNNPQLTAGRFIENPYKPGEVLYRTGDLGRRLPDGSLQYIGRIDHQVQLRGFRIELGEIESQLLKHEQIKEAVIIDRGDGADKYLCAYIVSHSPHSPNSTKLREFLSQVLPDYMIPSYFVEVEKMPLTPNGKINRKALPEPGKTTGTAFVAPRDELERKLAGIWCEILNIPDQTGIGIDDHFFDLGGHSLKAAALVSQMHREFDVKVPLVEIFRSPSIRALVKYIKQAHREVYASVETAEKREYYAASAMQKRLFILDQLEGAKTAYNLPGVMTVKGKLNRQVLETAFHKLIARHESLRTSFHMIDDQPVQKIQKNVTFQLVGTEQCSVRTTIIKKFVRPFDLSMPPLLRVGLVLLAEEEHLLLFDMHHIISDGTSMGILIRDMTAFYEGREPGALTAQYKDFSGWQNSYGGKVAMEKQEIYWLNRFAGEVPRLAVFTDFPRPGVQSFEGASIVFNFGKKLKTKIEQLTKETGTTLYMVLLAVYTILLSRYARQEDIVVGTPAAGRQHPDFDGIIGLFINALAMRNYPRPGKTFSGFLEEVKENTLQAYENQGYPFDRLIGKLAVADDFSRNPLFDAELVVQNMEFAELKAEGLTFVPYPYESGVTQVDLALYVVETDDNIEFSLKYCTALFKKETMERFAGFFEETTAVVVENREIKLEGIRIAHELETMTTDAYNSSDSSFDF